MITTTMTVTTLLAYVNHNIIPFFLMFHYIPLQIFEGYHGTEQEGMSSPISVQLDWLLLSSDHNFFENLAKSPHKILEYLWKNGRIKMSCTIT